MRLCANSVPERSVGRVVGLREDFTLATDYLRAVITGERQVELERVPIPELDADDVLIRVAYCAICTWEQRVYSGTFATYPLLGGHEVSGTVESIGVGVKHVKPGDKVIVSGLHRCGSCDNCRRGRSNMCKYVYASQAPPGEPFGPAGFGEFITRKSVEVFPLAPDVDLKVAALGEPIACVLRSIKEANLVPGDRVMVVGAGIMGLLHAQLARGRGAQVILSEPDAERRRIAESIGVDGLVDPSSPDFKEQVKALTGEGPTVVFVAVSVPKAIEQALSVVAGGGKVLCYASQPKGSTITVDPNLFHHREVTLKGTVSQVPNDFYEAAALISSGTLNLEPLLTSFYPLSDIAAALDEAVEMQGVGTNFRVVVQTDAAE